MAAPTAFSSISRLMSPSMLMNVAPEAFKDIITKERMMLSSPSV
jgi:hypothetical protein